MYIFIGFPAKSFKFVSPLKDTGIATEFPLIVSQFFIENFSIGFPDKSCNSIFAEPPALVSIFRYNLFPLKEIGGVVSDPPLYGVSAEINPSRREMFLKIPDFS